MNPDHPYSRFFVGNLDTLSDRPGEAIRDDLVRFYQQHYSANLMSLAVIGRQSTTELRQLVEQLFSAVPNRDLPRRQVRSPLYRPDQLPRQLDVKTLKQTRQLSLTFPIPPVRQHWRSKPVQYLASLIGYEGEGSLLSELKARGWARALGASTGLDLPEVATLEVNIELTQAGLEHYQEVVKLFFAFVEKLRHKGIQEPLYAEEGQLARTRFRFLEPQEPIHEVLNLAASMPFYPRVHLLDAPYRFDHFDPELISTFLAALRPDNLILTRAAQDVPTSNTTDRYHIHYSLSTPDPTTLADWQQPSAVEGLHVRSLNPFVPDALELVSEPATEGDRPQRIWHSDRGELWYLQDSEFKQPRAGALPGPAHR